MEDKVQIEKSGDQGIQQHLIFTHKKSDLLYKRQPYKLQKPRRPEETIKDSIKNRRFLEKVKDDKSFLDSNASTLNNSFISQIDFLANS